MAQISRPCARRCGNPASSNGKCTDCQREYMRAYRATARGAETSNAASRAHSRRRAEKDPGYSARHTAAWRAANPEAHGKQSRAYVARRRARLLGATVEPFTTDDLYQSWADREMWACVCCGAPWEHRDHFVPLARGGAHTLANLVPACAACNRSKGSMCPYEWLESIGLLR